MDRPMELTLCILLLSCFVAQQAVHAAPDSYGGWDSAPTVRIAPGVVIGTTTSVPSATAVVNKYLGIPFAKSPPERFSPPKDPKRWSAPLLVKAVKPACIQPWNYPGSQREFYRKLGNNPGGPLPVESEDCLYLNVFAPSTPPPAGGRAVMFWLYGGAFKWGDASQLWYDGFVLAANQDVIVVAPNYRTNVFGFSNSPLVPLGNRNAGLLDQRKALAWVQENIARFGGSPKKVTIWGWSAGAASVNWLVTSMPKNPPFHAAIMEGGQATYFPYRDESVGLGAWNRLAEALNCSGVPDVLKCVRGADALKIRDVLDSSPSLAFNPIVDNVTVIANMAEARAKRRIADVPVLLGANADEGQTTIGVTNATAAILGFFPNDPQIRADVEAAYPIGKDGIETPNHVISRLSTDLAQCSLALLGQSNIEAGYKTWRFCLKAYFPNTELIPNGRAYHGTQVPLVRGSYPAEGATPQEIALSKYMQGAWADFSKNPKRGPGWESLGLAGGADLGVLGANGSIGVTTTPERR